MMTRVCIGCRRRKPIGRFRISTEGHARFGNLCHSCHPDAKLSARTKRCVKCRVWKYLRYFAKHTGTADGVENRCKACRQKYDHARPGRRAGAICIDCQRPSHFRRCEPCRAKHQAATEALLRAPAVTDGLCGLPTRTGGCPEPLSFGTDFLGRTTMWCPQHGERLLRVIGVRHYDQRVVLDDEIDAAIERASKRPAPNDGAGLNGAHFRRESNAYVGDHPWRQKKRSAA